MKRVQDDKFFIAKKILKFIRLGRASPGDKKEDDLIRRKIKNIGIKKEEEYEKK